MASPNIRTWTATPGVDLSQFGSEWQNVAQRGIFDSQTGAVILQAEVVVDEDGEDDLIITEFPVEQGAVINDHAFKRPASLRVRMGWSNAYAMDANLGNVRDVYQTILRLQASRLPFTVWTGKREYQNMLVASLRTHTDHALEFALIADIEFREIVLVNTSVQAASAVYGPVKALADPPKNTPTKQTGPVQPVAAVVPDAQVVSATGYAGVKGLPGSPSGPSVGPP